MCSYIMCDIIISFKLIRNVLSVVGLLWVVVVSMRLLTTLAGWFCAFYLAPWGITRINLKKYGPWAGKDKVPLFNRAISRLYF